MSPGLYLRQLRREARGSGGRILFFIACLAIGVAAVVAVASLSLSLETAVRREARQLLAADLKISGRRPLPQELETVLAGRPGLTRTDLRELVTLVAVGSGAGTAGGARSQLVELKVVDGRYPFYGTLELDPQEPLNQLLDPFGAVVAPDLLARLGIELGDALKIGGQEFQIRGTVLAEPDKLSFNLTMGPRVFLSSEGFDRTGLETFGSRIGYRALIKVPEGMPTEELDALAESVETALPDASYYNVETYAEAQPALRQGIRRVERFLGLVALVSLLIGGIGVAQTVRAWIAGRLDGIAILKCLGVRPREVLGLYLGQALLLGLAGSVIGAALGLLLPRVVPLLLGNLIPVEAIEPWQGRAVLQGISLGVGIALLFSLPPLARLLSIPPVRVLRRDAEPPPTSRRALVLTALILALGTAATAVAQSRSLVLGLQFTAGLLTVVAILALAAEALSRLARRLPRHRSRIWLRHGLAALGRPGGSTLGAIIALGLGVMVVLAMALVERHLTGQLQADLPGSSPTAFLIDIQPDQWGGVQELLAAHGAQGVDSLPVVVARLTAVAGTPVAELARQQEEQAPENRDRRWALTREQRLTYLQTLGDDNRILEGELWSDPEAAEVSVEAGFAQELGVKVGDRLAFDIQGVPLELLITSVRSVRWETFRLNFFLVVEPGVLEEAPQFRVATARFEKATEQIFQDRLAQGFPNVTVLRIREILEKIAGVLDRLALGVRFLGGFTVLTGLVILSGTVSASSSRRGREVALLKTLGLTRGGVLATFAVEYALIGFAAGLIGTLGGGLLAWTVLTRGMEIEWTWMPIPCVLAILSTPLLTALAGCAASTQALNAPPARVLQSDL